MGVVATLSSINSIKFEEMKAKKEYPYNYQSGSVHVGKAWEVFSYILSGGVGPHVVDILSEIIFPKERFVISKNEYMTEYLNYSSPNRVKEINDKLKLVSEEAFRELIEKRTFNTSIMYLKVFPEDKEELFQFLREDFNQLKKLFSESAKQEEYIATVIS